MAGRIWEEPELAREDLPLPGWGTLKSHFFSLSLSLHICKMGMITNNRETIYLKSYVTEEKNPM